MIEDLKDNISQTIKFLKSTKMHKIRSSRPGPDIFDDCVVEAYDSKQPLKNLVNISMIDAATIKIEPWDKAIISDVMHGVEASNLGFNPSIIDNYILIKIPPMSQEKRADMVKLAGRVVEESRVAIRNIRRKFTDKLKAMKKSSEMSEDEVASTTKQIQEIVDNSMSELDAILQEKSDDIMKH